MTKREQIELDHLNHTLKIVANELREGKFIAAYARVNSAQGVINLLLNGHFEDKPEASELYCEGRPCD